MTDSDATIAVIGLGCIYPGAVDVGTFWRNIESGIDAITSAPTDRIDPRYFAADTRNGVDRFACNRGGFVPSEALNFDPGRFGIMPVAVDGAEPDQLLALGTAAAAVDDAGGLDDVARDRVGVILGRGGYLTPGLVRLDQRVRTADQLVDTLRDLLPDVADDRLLEVKDAFTAQLGELRPESAIGLVPNLAASRIANRLDLGGPAYTMDAACASSLIAVDAAISELRSGRCDAVLAGGVHHCHDVTLWSVFSQLGALSRSGQIRPFARGADGILVAEGTGVLVLERLADAERLGHRIYATIAGTGVASDGRDATLMSPRVDGQVLALERAYRDAGIDPDSIGLIEGHGTATPAGDRAELETLRRVYGKSDDGVATEGRAVLGSVKSMIGHAMPAAGAAGLIKAILAVHHGVLPPTLHADEPNPDVAGTRFRLLDRAEPWADGSGRRRAGVNAFGFGGINAHIVIEQHGSDRSRASAPSIASTPTVVQPIAPPDPTGPPAPSEPSGRFRFDALLVQGRDAADVAEHLAAWRSDPHARAGSDPIGDGPVRLAVVDPTERRLDLAARLLEKGRPWRGRNDIWFEPSGLIADGGRVAFLLPGVEPTFDADVTDVAAWFGLNVATLPEGATELEAQGRGIFAVGRILHTALVELGVVPDDIAGHSLGEWTGVFTAELVPAADADRFLDDLEPGSLEVPGVVFAALGCGVDVASEVIADLDDVVVSHDNCPHQSVICGPADAISQAMVRLAGRKIFAQELPFRSGFHSPAFEPYLDIVRHHWDRMPLQPARIPLWSATTCSPYPADPDAVRRLAADHLVLPVRFRELVRAMHDDGVRAFVQLGVGSLVSFVDDTLRGEEQMSVSAHAAARSGMDQLARAATALWVQGVDIDLDRLRAPLAAGSPLRPARPDHGRAPSAPTVRLTLATPSIRLSTRTVGELDLRLGSDTDAAATRTTEAPEPAAAGHRRGVGSALQDEHDLLLSESLAAGRQVLDARAARPSRRATAPERQDAPGGAPVPADPPGTSTREVLRVDLDTFPWLIDHCFYRQADGWTDLSDRFPVLPMTTMVEMLGDAARRRQPGLVVTRIENIRAMRWLPASPAVEVTVTTRVVASGHVEASIDGYARATVRLAAATPPAPRPAARPLTAPRPSPVAPGPLYEDHWMFHGPTFQGVRTIDALGDDGVDGVIESLPTPGAFLDNAGQLYGWWVIATVDQDFLALPQSIDAIERFGAPPPIGALVTTTVRITEVTDRTVRADLELVWDGVVNVRIAGWVDRRFDSDEDLWLMLRQPEDHLLAAIGPSGVAVVAERWRDSASRELMARRYLTAAERTTYEGLNPRAQRLWLLGRIAAKDAVRHALWDEGHGPLFPAELTLRDDGPGAVIAHGGAADGRRVALATTEWLGVARLTTAGGAISVTTVDPAPGGLDRARDRATDLLTIRGADVPATTVRTELIGPEPHSTTTRPSGADLRPNAPDDRKDHLVAWTDLPRSDRGRAR